MSRVTCLRTTMLVARSLVTHAAAGRAHGRGRRHARASKHRRTSAASACSRSMIDRSTGGSRVPARARAATIRQEEVATGRFEGEKEGSHGHTVPRHSIGAARDVKPTGQHRSFCHAWRWGPWRERPAARHGAITRSSSSQIQASAWPCARCESFWIRTGPCGFVIFACALPRGPPPISLKLLFRRVTDADPPSSRPPYVVVGRASAAGRS
jgi:hypothetical protein